jgi:hypothetical protein
MLLALEFAMRKTLSSTFLNCTEGQASRMQPELARLGLFRSWRSWLVTVLRIMAVEEGYGAIFLQYFNVRNHACRGKKLLSLTSSYLIG